MNTPTVYSGIVSAKSRRLRTVGIVLLAAVCAMALYGYFVLLPSIERSLREHPAPPISRSASASAAEPDSPPITKAQRVRKFQVAVALAYWGVCALMLVAVVLVAWLDFREVTRVYAAQRRDIWTQAVSSVEEQSMDDSS